MIELIDVRKSFEDRSSDGELLGTKEVLKGISTTFEDGKTNLIIGQSGSGKTVLIKT